MDDIKNLHHVVLVHDRNARGSALYVDSEFTAAGCMDDAGFLSRVVDDLQGLRLDFSVITVAKPADKYFPEVYDGCMLWQPQDYDAELQEQAKTTAPPATMPETSRQWAARFWEANGRFPLSLDYHAAGYGAGSQCACASAGECVLKDATVNHCNRNCYTVQLQDYIALTTKTSEKK